MYFALDIGSSFIKLAMLENDHILLLSKVNTPKALPLQKGICEIDSAEIFNAVKKLIDNAITQCGTDIEGILISTQMHGLVPRIDGVMGNYISWQDRRCLEIMDNSHLSYLQAMQEKVSMEQMAHCGVYFKNSMGLCNLFALLNQNNIAPNRCEIFSLGSFIINQLSGGNIAHITNAAPIGMVDLVHNCWDERLFALLGLDGLKMPAIINAFVPCGRYRGISVFPDIGDQQAAILGSGTMQGDININIGTAGQISILQDKLCIPPTGTEIRPYFDGKLVCTVTNLPAGRNLEVLINFFSQSASLVLGEKISSEQVWENILDFQMLENTDLRVSLDFFEKGASIYNINEQNFTPKQLLFAAYNTMAEEYTKALQKLNLEKTKRIVFCGGLMQRIRPLTQLLSVKLGIPDYAVSNADVFYGLYKLAKGENL